MSAPRIIPDTVRDLQAAVSNPDTSAWVAANAGSGKTHVLVQRVINLLLDNVDPAKILCITFTKAAAANMAKRVFDRLAEWTTLDDAALDAAIRATSNVPVNAARRALARRLFAKALETPGGLKVQTIHAFCTQLLHQFPFEANVAARFTVLDETAETQLLQDLSLDVLLAAAGAPDSAARPRAGDGHHHGGRPDLPRRRQRSDRQTRRNSASRRTHRQRRGRNRGTVRSARRRARRHHGGGRSGIVLRPR